MPVPLFIVASAIVGLAFALAAWAQLENGRSPLGPTLWVPVLYQILLVTPAVLYLSLVHPAWSWLYLADPARLPLGTTAIAVLATAAAMIGGYLAGWGLLRAGRRRELAGAVALGMVALGVAMAVLRGRLGRSGTFAEFAAGAANPIGARKLGPALMLIAVGLLLGLVAALRFLVEQGHREREG